MWSWAPFAAAALLAVGNPVVVVRVRAWVRRSRRLRRWECEVCGGRPRRVSVAAWRPTDDDDLGVDTTDARGINIGGTAMTAMFCHRHLPQQAKATATRRTNPR